MALHVRRPPMSHVRRPVTARPAQPLKLKADQAQPGSGSGPGPLRLKRSCRLSCQLPTHTRFGTLMLRLADLQKRYMLRTRCTLMHTDHVAALTKLTKPSKPNKASDKAWPNLKMQAQGKFPRSRTESLCIIGARLRYKFA